MIFQIIQKMKLLIHIITKQLKKIKDLKEQLKKHYNQLTVIEYNYKKAIFKYLILLINNNNEYKRMDINLEVI